MLLLVFSLLLLWSSSFCLGGGLDDSALDSGGGSLACLAVEQLLDLSWADAAWLSFAHADLLDSQCRLQSSLKKSVSSVVDSSCDLLGSPLHSNPSDSGLVRLDGDDHLTSPSVDDSSVCSLGDFLCHKSLLEDGNLSLECLFGDLHDSGSSDSDLSDVLPVDSAGDDSLSISHSQDSLLDDVSASGDNDLSSPSDDSSSVYSSGDFLVDELSLESDLDLLVVSDTDSPHSFSNDLHSADDLSVNSPGDDLSDDLPSQDSDFSVVFSPGDHGSLSDDSHLSNVGSSGDGSSCPSDLDLADDLSGSAY